MKHKEFLLNYSNGWWKCLECGESHYFAHITRHIKKRHNLSSEEYYNKHVQVDRSCLNPLCSNKTVYSDRLDIGYRTYCSKSCGSQHRSNEMWSKDDGTLKDKVSQSAKILGSKYGPIYGKIFGSSVGDQFKNNLRLGRGKPKISSVSNNIANKLKRNLSGKVAYVYLTKLDNDCYKIGVTSWLPRLKFFGTQISLIKFNNGKIAVLEEQRLLSITESDKTKHTRYPNNTELRTSNILTNCDIKQFFNI